MRADVALLSSSSIIGTRAYHQDQEVLEVKRAMIASSAQRYLMADHQKFGRTALHLLSGLDEFDAVVTTGKLAEETAEELQQAGITLCFAEED